MKTTRRTFIATASAAALTATTPTPLMAQKPTPKLIHHVFFWLNNVESGEDRKKLLEGLRTLGKIETVRDFRIGRPARTEKREVIDDSYTFSLFTVFDDVTGHDAYQVHPIHLKFIDENKHLWAKVQVYDVEAI
ncbi:MAG: Dabb family protein [Cyclobacteriaceae bacterium]|nr:Dabb family protein [Cyclobacteriaceae bacterium]